jgi:hypothetical protein
LNFIKIARKGSDAIKKDLNKSKKVKIRWIWSIEYRKK